MSFSFVTIVLVFMGHNNFKTGYYNILVISLSHNGDRLISLSHNGDRAQKIATMHGRSTT